MPMPEAAVDEDDGFVFRKDDVGADEANAANDHFRKGVLSADAAHVPGATLFRQAVAHNGSH